MNIERIANSRPVQSVLSATPNVGDVERVGSIVVGLGLAVLGFTRKSIPGMALIGLGAAVLARGVTGRCGVYGLLGIDRSNNAADREPYINDKVDRASWESFPASDAPARNNFT